MMLPILISVSLAPGSYFFCAAAALSVSANATKAVKATNFLGPTDIVSLPVDVLFYAKCRKSRRRMQASACSVEASQLQTDGGMTAGWIGVIDGGTRLQTVGAQSGGRSIELLHSGWTSPSTHRQMQDASARVTRIMRNT